MFPGGFFCLIHEAADALTTSSSWNLSPKQDTKFILWTGVNQDDELNSKLFIIIFRTNTNPHSISLWSDMASYTE